MVTVAERTFDEVDMILWLVEATTFIGKGERHIAEQLKKAHIPVILVMNKIDTVKKEELLACIPLSGRGTGVLRRRYGDRSAGASDRSRADP